MPAGRADNACVDEPSNMSVIGRLLEEVSWEGKNVKAYRDGGRGRENVLTAEVMLPLSFLPRDRFLGAILRSAHGADAARMDVAAGIEEAIVTLLPEELTLPTGIKVQPDAQFATVNSFTLIEAKRLRRSEFQVEQLAREFLALLSEAGRRVPLLLLILGKEPPVSVTGHGRLGISDAVTLTLPNLLDQADRTEELDALVARIPEVVAWVTWGQIRDIVVTGRTAFEQETEVAGTMRRLCDAVVTAIDWHS